MQRNEEYQRVTTLEEKEQLNATETYTMIYRE
jgi:hypothetical protein